MGVSVRRREETELRSQRRAVELPSNCEFLGKGTIDNVSTRTRHDLVQKTAQRGTATDRQKKEAVN